jgi:hypothetical protein
MRTIVERFGRAIDAFCYSFRRELSPKVRGLIYVVSFFALALLVAHRTDLQRQREDAARAANPTAAIAPPVHAAAAPMPRLFGRAMGLMVSTPIRTSRMRCSRGSVPRAMKRC